jgi:hypothetical protein
VRVRHENRSPDLRPITQETKPLAGTLLLGQFPQVSLLVVKAQRSHQIDGLILEKVLVISFLDSARASVAAAIQIRVFAGNAIMRASTPAAPHQGGIGAAFDPHLCLTKLDVNRAGLWLANIRDAMLDHHRRRLALAHPHRQQLDPSLRFSKSSG